MAKIETADAISTTGKSLPQIVCLHGRGSNATILRFQMRLITNRLASIFEFIYLDGPFPCEAGPGILPWFEGMGPYFSWGSAFIGSLSSTSSSTDPSLTSQTERDEREKRDMAELNQALNVVLAGNQASRVVGVLGFSQGTRVVSGLLKRQEILEERKLADGKERAKIKFGVLVCGGGGLSFRPFNLIPPEYSLESFADAGSSKFGQKIQIPTLHVHGTQDKIAQKGKELVETWFEGENARVLDVEAGHHFPREPDDVTRVCSNILEMWEMHQASWKLEQSGSNS